MPTIAEQGVPGYDAVLRYALVAPAGTPRPIIDKLNKALNAALATDEVKKRLALEGAEPVTGTPDQYAADLDKEITLWAKVVKELAPRRTRRRCNADGSAGLLKRSALIASALPAHAQSDYPNKPITLVIALPPGGSNDIMARAVADKMGAALGQQIVVENRASAGSGTVTTRAVARGPADGYTLLLGYTSTLATGPHMFPNVGYDVRKDFAPIGLIAMAPALILVHPSVTYSGVADLIADMRASKEPFQVGTPGVSTVNHLSALLFAQQAGVKLQYIPYKGSGPLNTELIGGFVKVGFNPIPVSRGAIEGKLIRALAATSLQRASAYPDLPTVAESGLPGYDAVLTYGIVAPAGTPRPIVEKLSKTLRDALATDEVSGAFPRRAPSRCQPRRRSTPPSSTARTPNGRRSSSRLVSKKNTRNVAVKFALTTFLCALLAGDGTGCHRAGLSIPADHAGRGLRGRRRQRHHGARCRGENGSGARPADRDRESRAGAGGSIATRAVAKAAPDGYTLVLGGTGTLAINPTLYPNVGYDPRKDFAPIGLIGTSALVLVVHPSVPAKNIKELIAYAKANPGKLNYASAGVGSGIHLAAEIFRASRPGSR